MRHTPRILLFGALLAAASLAMAGPVQNSANRAHGKAGPDFGNDPTMLAERQLAGALRRLDLTAEQQAATREIFDANREDLQANRQAGRALRESLLALLGEDPLDEAALAELARREGELAEERLLLGATLASQVLAELTAEQRSELEALRGEWEERRRERVAALGERKPDR